MGNVIIGQSGGPTAVINSSLAGAIKAAKTAGIPKVYGMHHGIEGFLKGDLIDMDDYLLEMSDLSLLKRTPAAFLGTCRYKLPDIEGHEDVYESMFRIMEEKDIEYFLYNGGNDSMDTIMKMSTYAAQTGKRQKFMGIPKTVDNDLPVTDHTPGYGSAAKFIATMMKEVICDNESYGASEPRICIAEIMGRNAGWLTAASALSRDAEGSGPDLIYLPEVDFDEAAFLAKLGEVMKVKKSIVVAVSEGIHFQNGLMVCEVGSEHAFVDAFGHKQLSGCGRVLQKMIAREYDLNARVMEFSIMQRSATHLASRVDIDEAFEVGYTACRAALNGETGKMITIHVQQREPYIVTYEATDIREIANLEKKMPLDWITPDGTYVTEDFLNYARPLIIGSITPYYANGLPKHMSLKHKRR